MCEVNVKRCGPALSSDRTRVLLRRMYPSSHELAKRIVTQVLDLPEEEVDRQLQSILDLFGDRHFCVEETFQQRFREVRGNLRQSWEVSENRQALIGSYFMQEYSIESAALFNPSIVPHPDQEDVAPGHLRFVLSLRATGEGHISSVTFRVGTVNASGRVSLEVLPLRIVDSRRIQDTRFDKKSFLRTCVERGMKVEEPFMVALMARVEEEFTLDKLREACSLQHKASPGIIADTVCRNVLTLAESEYEVEFPEESTIPQRVLFPSAPSQSHGIEDARFVRFQHDDGSFMYYATYTAYDGRVALPQLMETENFESVKFTNMSGDIKNKGFALFPRKINGRYWMLSRQDDESVMIMSSDTITNFENPVALLRPKYPWEFFKLGNCGSPVETPKGWLVLTHAVGPMRRYCISAAMVALDDPTKVIGRLDTPLIEPNESEREGYVPNVCYTCGFLIHNNEVIIPYAMSDSQTSFATVNLNQLYKAMGL